MQQNLIINNKNMQYKVEWIEVKNEDWKVCQLKGLDGVVAKDVSINRKNKKGEVFPNFDAITLEYMVEGDLWRSDAGKYYLFAPRPQNAPKTGGMGAQAERLMNKKVESIRKSQESRELGIMTSSSIRDAVSIALQEQKGEEGFAPELFKERIKFWRGWLIENWHIDPQDYEDPIK